MDGAKFARLARLGQTFTPHSPVSEVDLFSGRSDQIMAVATIVGQAGRQIAIFGERGVGKTSFASLINRTASTAAPTTISVRYGDGSGRR
jgi:ABC-type transport system involved in cytochrome bd biosynthesis fused ATPase/permease subunit